MTREAWDWLKALLRRHQLEEPDGRELYAYRCTETDFATLTSLSRPVFERTSEEGILGTVPGALFCLFTAEWIRRRYDGGKLSYADVLSAAHAPSLPYPVLRDLVVSGLRYWGRRVHRIEGGERRAFLFTLACEGGLPLQFLQNEGTALRQYFRALLRDVRTYRNAEVDSATLAKQASAYLPKSLRQDVVYALAGKIADAVWALQNQVAGQNDPIAILNHSSPNWRDRFPLELTEKTAQSFLEGLVSTASGLAKEGNRKFQLLRTLVHCEDTWQLRAELGLPGMISYEDASAAFGGDPSQRLELLVHNSDLPSSVIGWATRCQNGVLVERSTRTPRWTGRQASDAFQLSTRPRVSSSATLPLHGGGCLEDLPWVFVDDEGSGQELRFLGQGSIKTRYSTAWVAAPREVVLSGEGDFEIEEIGNVRELDRILYRVVGQVYVVGDNNDRCRIVTRSDASDEVSFRLQGKPLAIAHAAIPQYLGMPRVYAVGDDGSTQQVPAQQLRWRTLVGSREWQVFDACCVGDGELRYVEQGTLRFRTRIGVLPEGLALSYDPQLAANGGRLRIKGVSGVVGVVDTPANVSWKLVPTAGSTDVVLDIRCSGTPPEAVVLGVRWPSMSESQLTVPFPSGGPRFLGTSGRMLSPNALVPWDRLSGVRARVMSPTGNGRYLLSGTLHSSSLDSEVARAIWLREPIPQVDGSEGRISEIDLLCLQDDLSNMLSASTDLDAYVKLVIDGPDVNHSRAAIRVGRFDLTLEPTTNRLGVRMDTESMARIDGETLSRFKVEMFPLWAPEEGLLELEQSHSEGVPTGTWEFDPARMTNGPWIFTARDGDWNRARPLLLTLPGDEEAQTVEDTYEGDTLACLDLVAAIRLRNPERRKMVLEKTVERLRNDSLAPDWELVHDLIRAAGNLPPSSLDLLPLLAKEPEAVVMTLLKQSPADIPDLLALLERLPFSWRLLSIQAWVQATRRHVRALQGQLGQLEGCESLIERLITAVLTKAVEQHPYLELVFELLTWDHGGRRMEVQPLNLRMASTKQGRLKLQKKLTKANQDLLLAHCDDDNWPPGSALTDWVAQQMKYYPETGHIFPATPQGTGFRKPVLNAPIATAMISVYGLSAPSRVVFEILSLRTFDKRWFDEAYRLALTQMLGYRLEKNPNCWEVEP